MRIFSLFDVGNVNPDGTVTQLGTMREVLLRCNYHFHADSAFNPRRAGISLLLAHHLPPKGTGGATEFADSRSAYDALSTETKERIDDWVVMNSQLHCRRVANPGNPLLDGKEFDPMQNRFGKHKLVQIHEPSGRKNLYIAAHAHHVEGKDVQEGQKELLDLLQYAGREPFTFKLDWKDPGDLGMFFDFATIHREVGLTRKQSSGITHASCIDLSEEATRENTREISGGQLYTI